MNSKRMIDGFHGKWVFWTLLLLALLAGGCGGPLSPTSPTANQNSAEVEFQLLQLTNTARTSADVEPTLTPDSVLSDIARGHSVAMRDLGFFGHSGPDGRNLRRRLDEAGVDYSRAAENLAQVTNVPDPASFAYELLMDSERHRANILGPGFELVGVGVVRSDDTFWITQIFIEP